MKNFPVIIGFNHLDHVICPSTLSNTVEWGNTKDWYCAKTVFNVIRGLCLRDWSDCYIYLVKFVTHLSSNMKIISKTRKPIPRGQAGLEAKILTPASKNCPRPRAFVLVMSSNFLCWPRDNELNDGTGNHSKFAMIIYQCYPHTYLVLLIKNLLSSRSQ